MVEQIFVQIEVKKLRMLLSLADQSLRFSSGKGTHECKATIQQITDYLNDFVKIFEEHPLMLLLPIELPEGYEFVGASRDGEQFQLHLKKKE